MTLLEIAQFAARTVRMPDDVTLATAKQFAALRWAMIWDSRVWAQAVLPTAQAVPAGTQELVLDEALADRVLAVRWNTETDLPGLSWDTAYRGDPAGWDAPGSPIGYVERPKTAGHATIRFLRAPSEAGTVLVLAKRTCPPLVADSDSPTIPGTDQALIAYVTGDLLSHMGQTGRAQVYWQEGTAHQQAMQAAEAEQSQTVRRLIPSSDYTDGYTASDFPSK